MKKVILIALTLVLSLSAMADDYSKLWKRWRTRKIKIYHVHKSTYSTKSPTKPHATRLTVIC